MLHQQQAADCFESVPGYLENSQGKNPVVNCFNHHCTVAEHTSGQEQDMQHQ